MKFSYFDSVCTLSLLLSVPFIYFSLFRQREETKRDHVARSESEQITILKNCAAELAMLIQSSH